MGEQRSDEKKHLVLVHGFGLGAWCWYKLVSMLKTNGPHRVTALDLAGCGVHPKQLHQITSIYDYVQPLMDFLSALPDDEKVVLVGHSYGGIPISLAMEKFPRKITSAVFVTSYMPNCTDPPGTLIQEYFKRSMTKTFLDCEFRFDQESGNLPVSAMYGRDYMAAKLYDHCPLEDVELGKMLSRPNLFFVEELSKKSLLSQDKYGDIKRFYVLCEDDKTMDEEFQRYNIEKSPPNDVITIAGAGHMVMLSKTQDLCFCLLEVAKKY